MLLVMDSWRGCAGYPVYVKDMTQLTFFTGRLDKELSHLTIYSYDHFMDFD
jgi:hypothetical protein